VPRFADVNDTVRRQSNIHPAFPHWASPVMVTVRNQNGMLTVVGIERPAEMRER